MQCKQKKYKKKTKPDGWIVKLFSMLISSKHTGTGSFWIKKHFKNWREIIILGSFLFCFVFFLCEHIKQCDMPELLSARWSPVRSVYLWSEYRAVALPSIRTANCDWRFGWSLHPDLLCSSLHKSWCVLAAPRGVGSIGERLKQTHCLPHNNRCRWKACGAGTRPTVYNCLFYIMYL